MVGVAVGSSKNELSSENNPMIKYMLRKRENHARNQKHDYSHVFRSKTRWEMFRLSVIAMAVELAYAAETAFVSPILLQIGIDHKLMTMVWGLSPLIGFFVSPLLGSVSDRCKLKWGRRRPIIALLSLGILMGLILVPHGKQFGALLGDTGYNRTQHGFANYSSSESSVHKHEDPVPSNFKWATILTILGVILLDLDADTCQTPARTYMLDVCIPEDQPQVLRTFSLLAGFGGTIGYAIGGVDWEQTRIGTFLGGNIPTVFGLVTIIFIICFFVTVTTFREIPLKLIEQDNLLKPLTAADIKKELSSNNNPEYYIEETLELQKIETVRDHTDPSELMQTAKSIELDESDDEPVSLGQYLKSIVVMPKSMRWLSLTNLLCWMAHVTYCLYFTDFVGEAVFGGNPMATPGSPEAESYDAGVRFGCFGMSIYALSCSIYSLTVARLMEWFGTKTIYIASNLYFCIGMLVLGLWPTKWGVLLFSTAAGVLYGALFIVPYILVASYHSKNCFRVRKGKTVPLKQTRGLGTDVAIISSMVFVAQLIVSLSVGPLVSWLNTCAILYYGSFLGFLAAVSACFVLYV